MCKTMEDMRDMIMEEKIHELSIEDFSEIYIENFKAGFKMGFEEGFIKGITDTRRSVVRRMLEHGKYPLEEISNVTELPISDIKKLAAEQTP